MFDTTVSDCADEIDRFEFERRNLGRKDARAASMFDEGVKRASAGDLLEV